MDWFLYDNGLRHERVKGDQLKVLNVQSQICIIRFFPGNLLSVDGLYKLNFCIS